MSGAILTALSIAVLGFVFQSQPASAQTVSRNSLERMKTEVYRYGTGEKAKVVVRKNDGTRIKGYISRTGEGTFELTDSKTGRTFALAYSDVSRIKKQGISTPVKIAIIVGVTAAVVVVVLAIVVKDALDDTCFLGPCPQ